MYLCALLYVYQPKCRISLVGLFENATLQALWIEEERRKKMKRAKERRKKNATRNDGMEREERKSANDDLLRNIESTISSLSLHISFWLESSEYEIITNSLLFTYDICWRMCKDNMNVKDSRLNNWQKGKKKKLYIEWLIQIPSPFSTFFVEVQYLSFRASVWADFLISE